MRTCLIAMLLVSAPLTMSLLAPAASAACVIGSSNPNGETTEVFAVGAADHPDFGIWIENNCYPFTAHDGSQDQGTWTATYDGREDSPNCQPVPPVNVPILGIVPGTGTTHCTTSTKVYESRSVSYGPVTDLGVLVCAEAVHSCVWVTPRYLVYRCLLTQAAPLVINPVPGTTGASASVTCTVS